ncbi:EpsG family protein [Providencia rettgeri]
MYTIQRYKTSFLILLPPFSVYFLVSSLQYNVGSDYFSYIYIYQNSWVMDKYFNSGEYFFYYSNLILNYFSAPPQSIFFVFSFIQSFFIFYFFKEIKKRGLSLWLLFFIFFTVTNILHNQMNGIRQYAALTLLPIISLFLYDKKYFKFFIFTLIAMSFHSTAIIFFGLVFFSLAKKYHFNRYFIVFIISIPFYLLVAKYTPIILDSLGLRFLSYIDSEYFDNGNYITIMTKIYYLPALLLFFYLYKKNTIQNNYFSFTILIFSFTYWSFLMSLDIAILSRLSSYFWFFIIFPLYYIGVFLYQRSVASLGFYILYLAAPYVAKVTFLAKNEFIYNSIIFN